MAFRYLKRALETGGYDVKIVCVKKYQYISPEPVTLADMELLKNFIRDLQPVLIGVSMTASYYIELFEKVMEYLRDLNIPTVCGGVFATLSPEKCLGMTDYVVRGEGEAPILELANALSGEGGVAEVRNLVHRNDAGEVIYNPLRPLMSELDAYGVPQIDPPNEYLINRGTIVNDYAQLKENAYTVLASRGCMFNCAFCAAANYKRVTKGLGSHVRLRRVDDIIAELEAVKKQMPRLVYLRWVDSVFPTNKEFIAEFAAKYKEKIGIPFKIWTHPLKTDPDAIKALVGCGLYKTSMGIQSGSPSVRKDVFNRAETQEHIIEASRIYTKCKVPHPDYDYILGHPFETAQTIKETYELSLALHGSFLFNINGLKFMPQTDIVKTAIERGIATEQEMEGILYRPMAEQYEYMHLDEYTRNNSHEVNFWYKLIYMTQFKVLRPFTRMFARRSVGKMRAVNLLYRVARVMRLIRRYRHLGTIYLKGRLVRLRKG